MLATGESSHSRTTRCHSTALASPPTSCGSFRPALDHWSLVCGPCLRAPDPRCSLVHLGQSAATFVVGGYASGEELAGSWILDNDELVRSHDDPPARDRAGVAYDSGRNEVVMYGGNGSGCAGEGGNCNTTWILGLE